MLTSQYIKRDKIANVKMSKGQNSEWKNRKEDSEKIVFIFSFIFTFLFFHDTSFGIYISFNPFQASIFLIIRFLLSLVYTGFDTKVLIIYIRVFLGSPTMNLLSYFRNSKWRIQDSCWRNEKSRQYSWKYKFGWFSSVSGRIKFIFKTNFPKHITKILPYRYQRIFISI